MLIAETIKTKMLTSEILLTFAMLVVFPLSFILLANLFLPELSIMFNHYLGFKHFDGYSHLSLIELMELKLLSISK